VSDTRVNNSFVTSPSQPSQTCTRCGLFITENSAVLRDGAPYCATCAALPHINYVETFRSAHWGRRDGYRWVVGFTVPVLLAMAIVSALRGRFAELALACVVAGVAVAYFQGARWARTAAVGTPTLALAIVSWLRRDEPASASLQFTWALTQVIVLASLIDPRNRLAFRIDSKPTELRQQWEGQSNQWADVGLALAVMGLFAFPLAIVATVVSFVGLRRVNLRATPRVGRRTQAVAGIALGVVGMVLGVVVVLFVASLLRER
jgi:hypothetical protein